MARITTAKTKIDESSRLRKQIISYTITREVFSEYKSSSYSRNFYSEREADIEQHRAVKRYFNKHGVGNLPKFKDLNAEFNALSVEKRAAYSECHVFRNEQHELLVCKRNLSKLFDITLNTIKV